TVINACLPPFIEFSNLEDGALNVAAVFAFFIATSDAAGNVLSNRSRYTRLPPLSTTAIAPPGALFAFANLTDSATIFFAASSEIDFGEITWAFEANAHNIMQ